jgi:hypothetical protein
VNIFTKLRQGCPRQPCLFSLEWLGRRDPNFYNNKMSRINYTEYQDSVFKLREKVVFKDINKIFCNVPKKLGASTVTGAVHKGKYMYLFRKSKLSFLDFQSAYTQYKLNKHGIRPRKPFSRIFVRIIFVKSFMNEIRARICSLKHIQ